MDIHEHAGKELTWESIPAETIRRVLIGYLIAQDWTQRAAQAGEVEALDLFLQGCGQESVFKGLEREETTHGTVFWQAP